MNHDKKVMKVQNVYLEVQARYLRTVDGSKKVWFAKFDNHKIKYNEVIINFNHIDSDNPEFFLQPGQVIKVVEGEIRESQKELFNQVFLDINIFRQTDDNEKSKINHK